jgi:hypothetical protein
LDEVEGLLLVFPELNGRFRGVFEKNDVSLVHGGTGEVGEIGKVGSFILKLEGFSTAALSWTPSC